MATMEQLVGLPDNSSEATLSDLLLLGSEGVLRCPRCGNEHYYQPFAISSCASCDSLILTKGNRLQWWYPELADLQRTTRSWWRRLLKQPPPKTLYKILTNGHSPDHEDVHWPTPRGDKPGAWMPKTDGKLVAGHNGYHLSAGWRQMTDWLIYYRNMPTGNSRPWLQVYEAQTSGPILKVGELEIVATTARLVRGVF